MAGFAAQERERALDNALETQRQPALAQALADLTVNDPIRRWAAGALIACGLVFAGLGTAAYFVAPRLLDLNSTLHATMSESQVWRDETRALKEQTAGLKNEVESLRHYLASSSNEDVVFLKVIVLKPKIDPALARTIARNVHRYAEIYGKDPNLVLAIMAVESDFNPRAKSSVGATGLMQVMPQWKRVLGIEGDLEDPEVSIRTGLQILGFYSEMYRDVEMALTAYNRGPGPVDNALMKGRDSKNGYSDRVLKMYEYLKRMTVTSPP